VFTFPDKRKNTSILKDFRKKKILEKSLAKHEIT